VMVGPGPVGSIREKHSGRNINYSYRQYGYSSITPVSFPMEIPVFQPARLKDLRDAKDLTAEAVAKEANISQGTITKIEKGKTVAPGSTTLANIARALDVPMEYFYADARAAKPRRTAA